MVLLNVQIEPTGGQGWQSPVLEFGEQLTQLFGPNGCGKTPLIQSVAYALGYPVTFREDIYQHCESVTLNLRAGEQEVCLKRRIDRGFDAQIIADGEVASFYDEKEFSRALFDLLNVERETLTSTQNEPVTPYLSTFLPLFYLDQDTAYTSLYNPPASFIKDQYAEMVRLAFGIPPKHSFDKKKIGIEKKRWLEGLDRAVVRKQSLMESLTAELPSPRRSLSELQTDIEQTMERIEALKESESLSSDAYSAVSSLIHDRKRVADELASEMRDLRMRADGFVSIKDEIETEINTLSLNEEARRLFSSFEDICAKPECGLFLTSAESYGKNLLYLRDQVKDLDRNTQLQRGRITELDRRLSEIKGEIAELQRRRERIRSGEGIDGVLETMTELTKTMFALQSEADSVERLESEQESYIELLNEREKVQNDLASMGGSGAVSDIRLLELRRDLREQILFWLDTLHTKNVSREVHVDNDFGVHFGEEKIRQFRGSTLVRVILAIRAALFELYTRDPANRFRFFILDTPRQQDIEAVDLGNFIAKLKELARQNQAQVIFSTTEYHYECDAEDREWTPQYQGTEQKMFLGVGGPAE
ncbi:hypothetical protein MKP05_19365 [Halomonas sp. EGI 63088]|uniref:Rad50/SbcC-type AAA domain-containing protein n=1 Tax=Halomonas flagellata TaxID=2920385 RepID=A0ABS9RZH6_9GAMM|nr:hypothetical protein [Halomonas flagellata]MCH4565262.1 hypothetical protein [Halomonas flagellata]